MASIKLSAAVDRPLFRHGFLRHLLCLGWKIIVPCPGVGVAAEVFFVKKRVRVKQLASAQRAIAVVFEMPRQRDRAAQLGRLPPVMAVGVNTGGRRPQSGQQTGARGVATRRGTVGICEEHPALGQAVDVWRARLRMPAQHPNPVVEIIHRDEQNIRLRCLCLARRQQQQERKHAKPGVVECKRVQYCKLLICQVEAQRVSSTTGTVLASVRTSNRTVPRPGSGMSTVTRP